MDNQSIGDKFVEAITSTECLAAFLGAFAAFLLEAIRRWRSDRLANLAVGNEAIFALAQMFSHVTNVYNQKFIDRAQEVRAIEKREPHYIEFLPMEVGTEEVPRVHADRLGFLLGSYEPDLLNRLAAADREFGVLMKLLEQRNAAHLQWQQASIAATNQVAAGAPLTLQQVERLVGEDLSQRLRQMTESLQTRLPACANNLKSAAQQLTEVLSFLYPTRVISHFVQRDRPNAVVAPPSRPKPRMWRRVVRTITHLSRKPLSLPGPRTAPTDQ